jgi:hypothetical protein
MAIEQLFEALPLHYLQHVVSRFGAKNLGIATLVTLVLGVMADFAWMLYLRAKMVDSMYSAWHHVTNHLVAPRTVPLPDCW